jgi:hypothetical protein
MSGFLNLSDTLAAARQRAARSGENLRSLLSPSPTGSSTSGRGVTFATVGRQMAGSVGYSILDGEGLSSGEFSLRTSGGSGTRDLHVFVLSPESMSQLCLGAVSGGVKFCMLSNDKCSIQAHSRKVQVEPDTVYISGGKKSAYAHPRLPIDSIGGSLNLMLGEENFSIVS